MTSTICRFSWKCVCCEELIAEFFDPHSKPRWYKRSIRLPIGSNGARICHDCLFDAIKDELRR